MSERGRQVEADRKTDNEAAERHKPEFGGQAADWSCAPLSTGPLPFSIPSALSISATLSYDMPRPKLNHWMNDITVC